tara:strand:+ start:483 stop:821 length:339 start_codon:yes stop_codon:yes gene_type:complete
MTWKKILKIDMDEARRLGEKYLPKDMKEGREEFERQERAKQKNIDNQKYQRMKKKLMDLEGEQLVFGISPMANAELYEELLDLLDKARENIGEKMFDIYIGRIYNKTRKVWD